MLTICSVHCSYLLLSVHFQRPKTAADVVGGYTYEFIDQPPDDLLCQMCKHVAKEPQQLKCTCGAFYCMSCLARITSTSAMHKSDCPVKYKNEPLDHFPDHKSNERIQKLMLKCTNQGEGCDWTGELKDLDDHRSQCPKEEIPCTLSEVGCETRLPREILDDHIAQNQQQHLDCAVKSILKLKQELATTRGELQGVQETLSRCMDEVRTLPTIIRMSDYAQFKAKGETWYSAPFYSRSNECSYHLCIRPLKTFNHSEAVNVELKVLTRRLCPAYRTSLTVAVLNQATDASHITFFPVVISSHDSSFGENIELSARPYVHHQNAYPGVKYLDRDCIFFRVSESMKPWLVDPVPKRSDLVS